MGCPPDMTESELAWLAGLLEGEGCFGVLNGRARLQLRMTDEDVVRKAAAFLGASVNVSHDKRLGRKTMYAVNFTGKRSADWMKRLLPLMGARRSARIAGILSAY